MALRVTFENTQEIILSNTYQGLLLPGHGVYYLFVTGKLGEVTEGAGKTPQEAINDRYAGKLSANDKNIEIAAYFVFDKNPHKLRQYDNTLREYIDTQYKGGVIPFGACHLGNKIEGKNTEALIDFDVTQHLPTLIECVKSHHGISQYFNTRKPFNPRFGQQKAIDEIVDRLLNKNKCLFSGYTSIGKTIVSLVSVLKYFREWDKKGFPNWKRGGLVLITTPISDTLISFMDDLDFVDVGATRSQKYSYMTKKDWKNTSLENIKKRTDDGEVIFLLLTAQDLFYPPKDGGDYSDKIRPAYNNLTGKIDVWVRDEGHKFYRGERTSTLLDCLKASAILDLSATPYNFLDTYSKDTIVNRDLLWGSKHREYTGLPEIAIESYETPFAGLSDKIKALYDIEEGYHPGKWFVRDDNGAYDMIEDIVETYRLKYVEVLPKNKNHLNVNLFDKRVSLDVLPSGGKDDGAKDKYPDLAKVLNQRIKTRYFIDAWTLEKISDSKNISLEKYVDELLDKYQAVNILTCRKFTTGTNIPQISHINLFDKMSSPAELIQLIGRACRKVAGKNQVMLYNHCPGNKIELALGIAARKSADLSGESQVEYLQSIAFTKYPLNSIKPTVVTPEEIISDVNDYYKSKSNPRPSRDKLMSVILDLDINVDLIDLKEKYKPNQIKTGKKLSDSNKAKVKNIIKSSAGGNSTMTEAKLVQLVNLIESIFIESTWVAYKSNIYDVMKILNSWEMKKMFDEDDLNTVRDIISPLCGENNIYKFFNQFLKDKQEAYSVLPFEEVHDDIFIDTQRKREMGIVYVPMKLAYEMVDSDFDKVYNKGGRNFLVINALSGSIPYVIKQKYPDVNIFCAEYIPYFKKHLEDLISNCQVCDIKYNDKTKKTLALSNFNRMKFSGVLANYPYQKDQNDPKSKAKRWVLWHSFLDKGLNLSGYNSIVIPTSVVSPGKQWESIKKNLIKLDLDIKPNYFKGVGSTFCRIIWDENYTGTTTIVSNEKTYNIDVSDYPFLPSVVDDVTLGMYDKLKGTRKWQRTTEFHTSNISKWRSDNGSIEVLHSTAQTHKTNVFHPNNKKIRVGVSLSGYPKFNVMHNMAATQNIAYTECSTLDEANKLAHYLNSEEIQDLLKLDYSFKWNGWNKLEVIKLLG